MAAPAIPQNFYTQTGNIQVFVSWDITVGATSYVVHRSLDGVTYTLLASPSVNNYLDETTESGTQYWYKVAAVNSDGTGSFTTPQSVVPSPTGELSLGELRTRAQQRADRLNSQFVTLPEWNFFINQAMFELYDLLITAYEDYYLAPTALFTTNGSQRIYPLPNGVLTFQDENGDDFVPEPFYKLMGVDIGIASNNNAFGTVNNFNFIDRNKYVYPNAGGTLYGVFNIQYRVMGDKIQFIPVPSANQPIKLWYIPRLRQLLKDTDISTTGISGWLQYVIIRAAKYALDKEESDTTKLDQELVYLKQRIEETASNRDAGQPQRISDSRGSSGNGYGPGSGFPMGGF